MRGTNREYLESAEITVSGLESILMIGREPLAYITLPEDRAVRRSEIVQRLAVISNPVLCFGVAILGCLAVASWTKASRVWGAARAPGYEQRFPPDAMVFLRARPSPQLISITSLEVWRRDFCLPQLGFSILEAGSDAKRAGARYEIVFEKTQDGPSAFAWVGENPKKC